MGAIPQLLPRPEAGNILVLQKPVLQIFRLLSALSNKNFTYYSDNTLRFNRPYKNLTKTPTKRRGTGDSEEGQKKSKQDLQLVVPVEEVPPLSGSGSESIATSGAVTIATNEAVGRTIW